jgi:hypothetical protein
MTIDTTREARYGVTRKKHITVTLEGHDRIEAWAEGQGLSFSAAIEALALLGMDTDAATAFSILATGLLERIIGQQFNRFAKLLSQAAIASEATSWKADALLLNLIRREALADPEHFVRNMAVSTDPEDLLAARIRQMRDEMKRMAHEAAVSHLQKRIDEVEMLMRLKDEEAADE